MMKWRDERHRHTHHNTNPHITHHHLYTDTWWNGFIDIDWSTWKIKVIIFLYNLLFLVLSELCVLWEQTPFAVPIHLCLHSVVYQHDLIHLPCITVLLIIALLFLIGLQSLSPSQHNLWFKICPANDGRDSLLVISVILHTLLCYSCIVLECRKCVWEGMCCV